MKNNLKIVLWCGDAANQIALANKVANMFQLDGIVVEHRKKTEFTFKKLISKIYDKLFFNEINRAWFEMLQYYKNQFQKFPSAAVYETENINDAGVKSFTEKFKPDVIMVSGTSLIKKELLQMKPRIGLFNLHTGLSPYVKGGPNCTNWCISNNEFHLIGNSIMWIDEGIDSGNLIATQQVKLEGSEKLTDIHIKVMEAAHQLYLDVLNVAASDPDSLPNIAQNKIAIGKTYYSKMWNRETKARLLKNLRQREYKSDENIITVKVNGQN